MRPDDRQYKYTSGYTHKSAKPTRRRGESTREYNERMGYWQRTQTRTTGAQRRGETNREYNERKAYDQSWNRNAQRINEPDNFATNIIKNRPQASQALDTGGGELGVNRLSARGTGAKIKLAANSAVDTKVVGSASDDLKKGRGRKTPRSSRGLKRGGKVGGL